MLVITNNLQSVSSNETQVDESGSWQGLTAGCSELS